MAEFGENDELDATRLNAVDPDLAALRTRLQAPPPDLIISWERVFNLDRDSFQEKAPELLPGIEAALKNIQTRPYGQALFRDIAMNEHRTNRVGIVADEVAFFSNAVYTPNNDSIVYNTFFNKMLENMPDAQRNAMTDMLNSTGLNLHEIVLLHEGDHAARLPGFELPQGKTEMGIALGCFEEMAMDRTNAFRSEEGMPLRTDYGAIDQQIEMLVNQLRDSNQLEAFQLHGMQPFMRDMITNEFTMIIARSSTCANPPTAAEVEASGKQKFAELLNRLGVSVAEEPEPINPANGLLNGTLKKIESETEAPKHGLPEQTTMSAQRPSTRRPF